MQAESVRAKQVLDVAVEALDELKAIDLKVLDVSALTPVTDFMVVASGGSDRQVRALADNLLKRAKESGIKPLGIEGERSAEWVLVDLVDVVVHVMNPTARETYQLEKLWSLPAGKAEATPAP